MEALILSYALDTNGQNNRYVQAARRLNALAIGKVDPAGVVARYQIAARDSETLHIRSAHAQPNYLEFPHDITWWRHRGSPAPCPQHQFKCYMDDRELKALIQDADVIHLNNSATALKYFRIRKPALLHHHGSMFRNNPPKGLADASHYRMIAAVSTVDLLRPAEDLLTWLPTAYDVAGLMEFAERHRREPDGRVRLVHAPTNREYKHTTLLLTAVSELQDEGLPIDLDLIEGETWADCMKRKAQADIVYDQLYYGYGCNAVEAWGMGIPVISGADDWTTRKMRDLWGDTPYENATPATLKAVIKRMVKSEDVRLAVRARGQAHVLRYHDEAPALAILAELYDRAIRKYDRHRIPGKGPSVTFMQRGSRKVYDEKGEPYAFTEGKLKTDDPHHVERLRKFSRNSAFGIEEIA